VAKRRPHQPNSDRDHVEELAEEAKVDNPDPETRRETFELELMDERLSEQGESVELGEEIEKED
jgi:hypothetical protein